MATNPKLPKREYPTRLTSLLQFITDCEEINFQPSVAYMADATGCHISTAYRYLHELESLGYIKRTWRDRGDNRPTETYSTLVGQRYLEKINSEENT